MAEQKPREAAPSQQVGSNGEDVVFLGSGDKGANADEQARQPVGSP